MKSMTPQRLEAIEAARDAAALVLKEDGFVAQQIRRHLSCIAEYLQKQPLIAAGQNLLDLDPAGKEKWHHMDAGIGSPYVKLYFYSLPTAGALAPVLRVAAQGGFRQKAAPVIDRTELSVTWELFDLAGEHCFTIRGQLDSSKVVCRQVQVGTKEVPVYETKCDELAEEEFAKLSAEVSC